MKPPATREDAVVLAESGWWKTKTPREIVAFQLFESMLCMDFGDFHGAVEKVLGRPVFTHEFAHPEGMKDEFKNLKATPTLTDILEEAHERFGDKMIVVAPEDDEGDEWKRGSHE